MLMYITGSTTTVCVVLRVCIRKPLRMRPHTLMERMKGSYPTSRKPRANACRALRTLETVRVPPKVRQGRSVACNTAVVR
jgi:hypothetical protein